jgi:hypothetical protein
LFGRLVSFNASPPEETAWLVGCSFSKPLDADELAASIRYFGLSET